MKERETYYKAFRIATAIGERKEKDSQLKTLVDSCGLSDEVKNGVKSYYRKMIEDVELLNGNTGESK